MNDEIWKDIPGFEGKYQASTLGRIRSVDRVMRVTVRGKEQVRHYKGQVLKPGKQTKTGHLTVVLGKNYGSMPVHTAVALTFLGPRPKGLDVCHNDGNPENNRANNLRYDTRTENILDVYRTGGRWRKLDIQDIKQITDMLESGISGSTIAKCFDVSNSTISKIKLKRYKTCDILV